jgi:hypothetical protein
MQFPRVFLIEMFFRNASPELRFSSADVISPRGSRARQAAHGLIPYTDKLPGWIFAGGGSRLAALHTDRKDYGNGKVSLGN